MWYFIIGMLLGGLCGIFMTSQLYNSEIWEAKKNLELSELEAKRKRIELKISDEENELLDKRIGAR